MMKRWRLRKNKRTEWTKVNSADAVLCNCVSNVQQWGPKEKGKRNKNVKIFNKVFIETADEYENKHSSISLIINTD